MVQGAGKTLVYSDWDSSGNLVFRDSAGLAIVTIDGVSRKLTLGASTVLDLPAASVEAADLGANLKTGHIWLPLVNWREVFSNVITNIAANGGLLASDTTPILERINGATDKALRINWAANNVDELTQSFVYPTDLDDTAPVIVNLLLSKSANTDTAAVVAVSYFEGIGDTNAGGNTAALAASALAIKSVTIAAVDVGAYPAQATVSLIPGTHANDAIYLHGAWVTYTRKT